MAEESGEVNQYLEPCLSLEFAGGETIVFVVDTGFNGALCLPRLVAEKLGLEKISEVETFGIGGHKESLDVALASGKWFGGETQVEVLINDGDDRLLGSELLGGKILEINYRSKKVVVSD